MTQNDSGQIRISQLVLIPALITLAVTVLRLVGELQNWSATWFNAEPGGPLSLVGIVWLPPIFGIYFALKLAGAGQRPSGAGRAVLFSLLGLVIIIAAFAVGVAVFPEGSPALIVAGNVAALISLLVMRSGWPALFKALLVYGYLARIPVVVIAFFAIKGAWGTHYDGPPPGFPEMAWFPKFLLIGLLPQLFIWVAFTVIIGTLFGAIAVALTKRRGAQLQPST
jgi:hypothetical protein